VEIFKTKKSDSSIEHYFIYATNDNWDVFYSSLEVIGD